MNRVMYHFPKADLRLGHPGLTKLALKAKIDVKSLQPGEFVLFVNKRMTGLKLFAANNTVIYAKSPSSWRPFTAEAIREFPQVFDGVHLDYDEALQIALEKQLAKAGRG